MQTVEIKNKPVNADKFGWAAYHPFKGFGEYMHIHSDIDEAILDAEANNIMDADGLWSVRKIAVTLAAED